MPNKIDALSELAPAGVIDMYASRFQRMPAENRTKAIAYLRNYATVYYSPLDVPADITDKINELERTIWLAAQ